MNSLLKNLMMVCIVISTVRCGTYQDIYYNYDRNVDFTRYETFAWAPDSAVVSKGEPENTAYDNDIVRNNTKNYITHRLSERGYLVNIDSPDLIVQLVLLNEKKERVVTYHTHLYSGYYFYNRHYFPYYYPYYRYYTWYGWRYPPFWDDHVTTYTKTYVKGTITINMFDRKLKKLVWTGSAEGDIYDPVYIQYDVHPAIDRILKKFPIKSSPKHERQNLKSSNKIVRINDINREFNYRISH